jgi:hypothetical protein
MDRVDSIIVDLPTMERHLEGVMKIFLEFDNEYLIMHAYLWDWIIRKEIDTL